jgi:hypothetical protein
LVTAKLLQKGQKNPIDFWGEIPTEPLLCTIFSEKTVRGSLSSFFVSSSQSLDAEGRAEYSFLKKKQPPPFWGASKFSCKNRQDRKNWQFRPALRPGIETPYLLDYNSGTCHF